VLWPPCAHLRSTLPTIIVGTEAGLVCPHLGAAFSTQFVTAGAPVRVDLQLPPTQFLALHPYATLALGSAAEVADIGNRMLYPFTPDAVTISLADVLEAQPASGACYPVFACVGLSYGASGSCSVCTGEPLWVDTVPPSTVHSAVSLFPESSLGALVDSLTAGALPASQALSDSWLDVRAVVVVWQVTGSRMGWGDRDTA
jgi:hypothetical protein